MVAVTGANGRLGRALTHALRGRGARIAEWSRPRYDLDMPDQAAQLVQDDRPDLVIHAAAWTDVDGCARDPELANRRNGDAVRQIARATLASPARFVLISTNEVFDGDRSDSLGYTEDDDPRPANAYGESKLRGEMAAREAAAAEGRDDALLVIRTAWLFGPPGNDFPAKIVAAADRLPSHEPLRVVDDEVGSPTYTRDLAAALIGLLDGNVRGGVHHLVNEGRTSRLELARRVLRHCRPDRATQPMSRAEFVRASVPPAWAVLANHRAASVGVRLRTWQEAIDDYAPGICAA